MTNATTPADQHYTPMAQTLHWLLGLALIGVFALGLYMADLPFSPQRLKLYSWHKWVGMTLLALSLFRLVWRLTHRPPALPASLAQAMPAWQHQAHHATHHALYLLFLAVPLLGWAYTSAAGFPVVLFGLWQMPDFVPASKELADLLKPLHRLSAYAMAALVVLHIAAALKHQWLDRDGLVLRMLPSRA